MNLAASANTANHPSIACRIVPGHRVASGLNGDPRFPGGTVGMQTPHFLALGLDIRCFFTGTVNVSIAPLRYRILRPRLTLLQVKWHPVEPAEDFSFFDCLLQLPGAPPVAGLVYYPHPETKLEHFQNPDVLELLLPFVDGLRYNLGVTIRIPADQMHIESAAEPTSPPAPASS